MKSQRGDVVLVNYPFASGQGMKIRPALVVQCDTNNQRLDNTIIVQITSRIRFTKSEPSQLLIEIESPEGRHSGLIHNSAVSCENLFTIRQDVIIRKLGSLSTTIMLQIDECLKVSLGIV
ncbi:MAG: transcriptional modulator of MazE/toxin, MazF [Planctomycetaceae bacterium]|nr:transcriptional modulator of MazE/toxin, MazF [Planctomycetaceae bacterium]